MLILEWKITRNVSIRKSVPGKEAGIARKRHATKVNLPPTERVGSEDTRMASG